MNGADLLCSTLLANDIDVCFANPGTSEMHFVAALDRQPNMRCVLGLFEGVVTGAADGYARMADKPAATLLHLGPGLANGIANLHNAKRANTPMINVVGDHATYHLQHDAPLTSDIDSLARPVSHWLGRADRADQVGILTTEAIAAARQQRGQIATLILHADAAWGETRAPTPVRAVPAAPRRPDDARIRAAAIALRAGRNVTLLISGLALREAQLIQFDRISAATGARVLVSSPYGRLQRGGNRPGFERTPYVIDLALKTFARTETAILVGTRAPVAFFAYPNMPSTLLPEGCEVLELAERDEDLIAAIDALCDALGVGTISPRGASAHRAVPPAPVGALTAEAICAIVARTLPENAIVCDESITSGRDLFKFTAHSAPHDFLPLPGGAIGIGLPLAVGAGVACPDRKIVSLQADGSGMYTVQALWTQAREALDVVTIIFANRKYQILHGELRNVGANAPGENARRMLDLDNPELDWVRLAQGMGVEAARVTTAEGFADLLATACRTRGPFLIEAVM